MINLRGINFGSVFAASGTLNFFGNGYWFHRIYRFFLRRKFEFARSTFISKTVTLEERMDCYKGQGNLKLDSLTFQPAELFPDCIWLDFLKNIALNAIAWSNPGIKKILLTGNWQKITKPFVISIGAAGLSTAKRLSEISGIITYLEEALPSFSAPIIALELNPHCPNMHPELIRAEEIIEQLQITRRLDVPQGIKISPLTSISFIKAIDRTGLCDYWEIPNTVHWNQLPLILDREAIFGKDIMPLARYGGGSYSGPKLFDLALAKTEEIRKNKITRPIIVGSVSNTEQIRLVDQSGGNGIAFARTAIMRPWRVQSIIQEGNWILG
jgi:dihydroorotate dehydrogenase